MRILSTKEFAKLPKGTLFSLCNDWSLAELCVKGETLAYWGRLGDEGTSESFGYAVIRLAPVEECSVTDETENSPIAEGMQFPMNFSREKQEFQPHELFAVWEREDLQRFLEVVKKAMEVVVEGEYVSDAEN